MSAASNTAELISIAFLGQENFNPAAEEQRAPRFLSLAPTTSSSYPTSPSVKSPAPESPVQSPKTVAEPATAKADSTTAVMPSAAIIDEALKTRRSSSLGSDGGNQKRRFLKLGPVHFGAGDGQDEWSEVVDA